jgi:hypothetical protein
MNFILFSALSLLGPHRPPQYLGPETLMPLASLLAAIAGFFLIFWRLIVKFVKTAYRKIRGLPDEVPPEMDMDDPSEEETEN